MKDEAPKTFPPALRACWIKLNSVFAKKLQNLGLTPDQYSVLRWLHEIKDQEIYQKNLTILMFTDPNNVASLLKRMEYNGLIKRFGAGSDKRKKNISSTNLGTEKWLKAKVIAKSLEKTALSTLSKDEIKMVTSHLKSMSQYFNY